MTESKAITLENLVMNYLESLKKPVYKPDPIRAERVSEFLSLFLPENVDKLDAMTKSQCPPMKLRASKSEDLIEKGMRHIPPIDLMHYIKI